MAAVKGGSGFQPVMTHAQRLEAAATQIPVPQGAQLPRCTREDRTYTITFRLADTFPQRS
ncbi:hypothetical protein [Schlesneria sp.]|uniref:hypothetical protein n=1 Tax=Schlesneria sp. TaxID=2762018 RepID=UPI002EEC3771